MAIPHAAYLGIVVAIRLSFPAWVSKICRDRMAPNLLKWYYPLVATIAVLHHARSVEHVDSVNASDDVSASRTRETKPKSKLKGESSPTKDYKKPNKTSRRRRSSLGDLLHRKVKPQDPSDGLEYTKEQVQEDVNYWLHFWILNSALHAAYTLACRVAFVASLVRSDTFFSVCCQVEFLFYIWIFVMPEMLMILFPSAGIEERHEWSPMKQWCYTCACNPVLALPSLVRSTTIPIFESVSQAVPAAEWKQYVVDNFQYLLNAAVMLRVLSEQRSRTLLGCMLDFRMLVVPAVTLFTPGFITQYGVWYVQYIVPQAHSLRGLHRQHRHEQRIIYLKFWVLHGFVAGLLDRLNIFLWWFPFFSHFNFVIWCVLVLPCVINTVYNEFDKELQAFGLLPSMEQGLTVEETHTHRALSLILSSLPSADDAEPIKLSIYADTAITEVETLNQSNNNEATTVNCDGNFLATQRAGIGDTNHVSSEEADKQDIVKDAIEMKGETSAKADCCASSIKKKNKGNTSERSSPLVEVSNKTEATSRLKPVTAVRRSGRPRCRPF